MSKLLERGDVAEAARTARTPQSAVRRFALSGAARAQSQATDAERLGRRGAGVAAELPAPALIDVNVAVLVKAEATCSCLAAPAFAAPDTLEAIRADLGALVGGATTGKSAVVGPAMGIPMTAEAGIPALGAEAGNPATPQGRLAEAEARSLSEFPTSSDKAEEIAILINSYIGLGPISALEGIAPAEPSTAAEASRLHMRRQLGAAMEWGFAFLDAFDLGPLALDVVDDAIATLDALDAPDEDCEPWLAGAYCGAYPIDAEDDSEHLEGTALESFGRGFVRAGEDDAEEDDPAEDGHDAEQTYEDGSEDDPHPWRFERPDAVKRAAQICEVARHG